MRALSDKKMRDKLEEKKRKRMLKGSWKKRVKGIKNKYWKYVWRYIK